MGLLLLMGGGDYNVRSELFGAGEAGAWYDPSDLTTMFTDTTGTTAVASSGDPVGLILDKSAGAFSALGSNLTSSFASAGFWSTNITGVTFPGTTAEFDASADRCTAPSPFTSGRWYQCTIALTATGAASLGIDDDGIGGGPGVLTTYRSGITSNVTFLFRATSSSRLRLIQAGAGTVSVSSLVIRLLPGNHAFQTSSGSRPSWNLSGGLSALSFDGSDDFLTTSSINFSSTDKITVLASVRKTSDVARGTICELTASAASNNGAFHLTAPNAASDTFAFESKGTTLTDAVATGIAAPVTRILTGLGDISGDSAILRVNQAVADTDTGDQGTGNYSNAALFIGRRGGTSLPFTGLVYQLIVRGAATTGGKLSGAEGFVGKKAGL